MENTANHILLVGQLGSLPEYSHTNHGRSFYRFSLEVERLSGAADILPILASEEILEQADLFCGGCIEVIGQIRSFNSRATTGRKLILSIYAESVQTTDAAHENDAHLEGVICKEPVYRRTPLGREICDVMLAVSRLYHRTDYIPCILWGRSAAVAATLPVGSRLSLNGRMQSREYLKTLPDRQERRVAYEMSVLSMEQLDTELTIEEL